MVGYDVLKFVQRPTLAQYSTKTLLPSLNEPFFRHFRLTTVRLSCERLSREQIIRRQRASSLNSPPISLSGGGIISKWECIETVRSSGMWESTTKDVPFECCSSALPQQCLSVSKLPCAAPPSADSADGRQFRQPITCVLAVAGGGITSKKWTEVTDY